MKKLLTITLTILITCSFAQETSWWNSWVKFPTNQPVIVGDPEDWNAFMSCPSVIHEEGIFKMWFRGIDLNDTQQQIGYAWSEDGVNWNVKEEPILQAVTPVFNCLIKGTGTVLRINDTLRMWYWAIFPDFSAKICYAWSVDDTTWHEYPNPVLERGEPGTWDENDPWLNHIYYDATNNQYHMYYVTSEVVTYHEEIGHAISLDGINWERDISNPVLNIGPPGSFYAYRLLAGPLIFRNDSLHMFFSGYDALGGDYHPSIGYAYSTDSPNWSEWTVGNNQQPVLTHGPPGSWDQKYTDLPGVLYYDGIYHMWYDGRPVSTHGIIGYAKQNVSCLSDSIEFSTQAQIDSFPINYPYCNMIEGSIQISGNDITNLDGLSQITSIEGDFEIGNGGPWPDTNPSLTSLSGLDNLTTIEGDLLVLSNLGLTSLSGLENLTFIGGSLIIGNTWYTWKHGNPELTSLTALENLDFIGGDLKILNNDVLSNCDINSICDYLAVPNGTVEIHSNAEGCNSQQEVEEACASSINEVSALYGIKTSPNPFSISTTLSYSLKQPSTVQLSIYNQLGQLVYQHSEDQQQGSQQLQWDAQDQPGGLYFYQLHAGDQTATGKLVKVR